MAKRKGYGRVSSDGQERNGNSLEDQRQKLMDAGCAEEDIVLETYTGTKMNRPKFGKLIEGLEAGDTLVVCKLDRFARTAKEGLEVVEDLMARGISVHILNMGLIEDTPMGRVVLTVMLAFAQFERDTIVERTQGGKEIARQREDYREGRPRRKIPDYFEMYREMQSNGDVSVRAACEKMGISTSQWYKWAQEMGA